MKLQLAISWMCRAIGDRRAVAAEEQRQHRAGRPAMSSAISAPVSTMLMTDAGARDRGPTRSQRPAPIFCAAIALTAAPIAIAGIWI